MILGSVTVLIIERKLTHAAAFALADASYVAVAAILYFCARRASFAPLAAHHAPPLAEQGRAETA